MNGVNQRYVLHVDKSMSWIGQCIIIIASFFFYNDMFYHVNISISWIVNALFIYLYIILFFSQRDYENTQEATDYILFVPIVI